MAIEDRDLQPGTCLVARYKGQEHALEVVQTDEGLRYRLADATVHDLIHRVRPHPGAESHRA